MHLPFIAHNHACQIYVTIMYTRLKCALHFITGMIVLISVQDHGTVDVLQRINYLIKEGLYQTIYLPVIPSKPIKSFNKAIGIHNMHQTHGNFCIFKFHLLFNFVYSSRLFTK